MNQIYACREGRKNTFADAKISGTATTNPTRSVSRTNFSKLLLGVFLFLVAGAVDVSAQTRTYTATGNFVVPPGVTQITFDVTGAGGGGAGSNFAAGLAGGGGGGGSFRRYTNVAVQPGQTLTITIGAGGTGGALALGVGTPGTAGGVTSIVAGTGPALPVAINHAGGAGGTLSAGGAGATMVGGSDGGNGGNGASGAPGQYGGGGGGEAASNAANGNPGGDGGAACIAGIGGAGGPGADGGRGGSCALIALPGVAPGGGGGGEAADNVAALNYAGRDGGRGEVTLTYTCPTYTLPAFGPFCQNGAALSITGDGVAAGGTSALGGLSPLFVANIGPTLSGTNVTGTLATGFSFNPTTAGEIVVTYSYTDPNPVAPACVTTTTQNVVVFPTSPVLAVPANTCGTGITVTAAAAIAGFTQQFSFDGGATWGVSNVGPATPGCYTITSRWIKNGAFGNVANGATSPCPNSASVQAVVFPANPVLVAPANTCATAITMTNTPVAGFTQQWSFDNGATWGTSNTSPTTPGCYSIITRYILTAACGGTAANATGPCGNSNTVQAVIFPQSVVLNALTNTCNTGLVAGPSTAVAGFTQQFSFDNGATWGVSNTGPATPGCYTVTSRYVITGACGGTAAGSAGPCANSAAVNGVVFPPSVVLNAIANSCATALTALPQTAVAGFTQQFSFDGGATWGTSNVSGTTPGCYAVTSRYVLTAACGGTAAGATGPCANSATVNALIYPATGVVTVTPTCAGTSLTPSMPAVAGFTTQFSTDGGATWWSGASPLNNAGCYSVIGRYVNTNACGGTAALTPGPCANSAAVNAIIYPLMPVLSSPTTTCAGTPWTLPAVPNQAPNFNTQWSLDNGATWSFNPTIPTTPGISQVIARYVNAAACGTIAAFTAGPACSVSNMVTAQINSTPAVTVIGNQAPVCCNTNIAVPAFSLSNAPMLPAGGTLVYNWTNSDPSIGLAAAGVGNIPAFNAVCAATTKVATITVTASYTSGGTTCTSAPMIFTITVNANVTGTINGPNVAICNGQTADINIVTTGVANFRGNLAISVISGSGTPTANVAFGNLGDPIGPVTVSGASAITIPANLLTNTSSNTTVYRVAWFSTTSLTDANNCTPTVGAPLTGFQDITVYPVPALTATLVNAPGDICPGTNVVFNIANPNLIPGSAFNWTAVDNNGAGATLGSATNVSFANAAVNTALGLSCPTTHVNPIRFTFTPVGPGPLGCVGTPVVINVNVRDNQAPVLNGVLPGGAVGNVCLANAPAAPATTTIRALYLDNCTPTNSLVVGGPTTNTTGNNCAWTRTYTYTVTDACNNTINAVVTYTGGDTEAPTWTTPFGSLNRTVEYCDVTALNAAQALAPTATDNCGGITINKVNGPFAVGACPTTGVIQNDWTATDACGNVSVLFTQIITIIDTRPPTITGGNNITLNVGSGAAPNTCSAILPNYILGTGGIAPTTVIGTITATDCAAPAAVPTSFPNPVAITYSGNANGNNRIWQQPAPGTLILGVGGTVIPVTVFAQDACGNQTSKTFNVTIVDQTAPIAVCKNLTQATGATPTALLGNQVVLNAAGFASITPSQIAASGSTPGVNVSTDGCGLAASPYTFAIASPSNVQRNFGCGDIPNGQQSADINVTLVVTDAAGNTATCVSVVRVVDNIAPVFTNCSATPRNVDKGAGCTAVIPDVITGLNATDACGPVTYTQSPAAGTIVAASIMGSFPVTVTATDVHTNSTNCTVNLNFRDVTPPTFAGCPTNQTINAGAGSCSQTASWNVPTPSDNCSPINGLGPITMTVTATGTTTPPVLTNVTPGAAQTATFFTGTTTVTYTATDAAGNSATCSFTVTVNDNVPPVITCPSGALTSGNWPAGAGSCNFVKSGTNWDATATDNCLLATPAVSYALTRPPSATVIGTGTSLNGVSFAPGVTRVTWTATDFTGNISTCFFDITVVDLQAPTFTCPATVNINTNTSGCRAQVGTALTAPVGVADNCGVTLIEWDVSGATPVASGTGNLPDNYIFNVGTSTVQYRIRDAANNIATCTFQVIVTNNVNATIAPANVTVGQNAATTSTVTFTGSGAGTVGAAQVQYTFNYTLNGVAQAPIATALGSTVTTIAQSNAIVGTYTYVLTSVTDQNGCTRTFPVGSQPTAVINVVTGSPDLTLSTDAAPGQVNSGGTINLAVVVRNIGTGPTSGTITLNGTPFSALTGVTLSTVAAGTTVNINGTDYTASAGWTFNAATGQLTSAGPIAAGSNSTIILRMVRGTAPNQGSPGTLNQTLTIPNLSGGEQLPQNNNNTTNVQVVKTAN